MFKKLVVALIALVLAALAVTGCLAALVVSAVVLALGRFVVYGFLGIFARPTAYLKRPSVCKTVRRTAQRCRREVFHYD